jgi:hypothetical protein
MDRNEIGGQRHQEIRGVLRIVGPVVAVVGLVFIIIGMGSFFSSFGNFGGEPPRNFWCVFVGAPLLMIGLGISKFAFLGAVGRYVAGEAAPVAKDTLDYLARGTGDSIKTVARAIGEGLSEARGEAAPPTVPRCRQCNAANDADAKFCKNCGAML